MIEIIIDKYFWFLNSNGLRFLLWFFLAECDPKPTFEIALVLTISWFIFTFFLIKNQDSAYFIISFSSALKIYLMINKVLSFLLIRKGNCALILWIWVEILFILLFFVDWKSSYRIIFILYSLIAQITFWGFMIVKIVIQMDIRWRNFIIKTFFRFRISVRLWNSLACTWFR